MKKKDLEISRKKRYISQKQEWFTTGKMCIRDRYCSDARTIEPERMPDFDLLCAGFPCQAFSIAGKREGFADARDVYKRQLLWGEYKVYNVRICV